MNPWQPGFDDLLIASDDLVVNINALKVSEAWATVGVHHRAVNRPFFGLAMTIIVAAVVGCNQKSGAASSSPAPASASTDTTETDALKKRLDELESGGGTGSSTATQVTDQSIPPPGATTGQVAIDISSNDIDPATVSGYVVGLQNQVVLQKSPDGQCRSLSTISTGSAGSRPTIWAI